MDQQQINEAEWRNTANWHFGAYYSPVDTRVWVSKPIRWTGWTLNFAHTMAWVWLAVILTPGLAVLALCLATAALR